MELLTMDKTYSSWTIEDDRLLYDNKHLSTVRLASLLGRGMHGVDARLKKLADVVVLHIRDCLQEVLKC